jgi:hypothetical protein
MKLKMRENLRAQLINLFKLFEPYKGSVDDSKVPFIVYGTLLGFWRDHDIPDGDKDVDVGILPENFDEDFLRTVLEKGGYKMNLCNGCKKNAGMNYRFKDDIFKKIIDLTVFQPVTNEMVQQEYRRIFKKYDNWHKYNEFVSLYYWVSDSWSKPHQVVAYPKDIFKNPEWRMFQNQVEVKVLPKKDAIQMFLIQYGDTWKTPKIRKEGGWHNGEKLEIKDLNSFDINNIKKTDFINLNKHKALF